MSLRDKILKAKDIKEEIITVEAWDAKILVRGLTGAERNAILQDAIDMNTGVTDLIKIYPDIVIACSYDPETGEKVFGSNDRDAINGKSGAALDEIAGVAMKLSGLDSKAVEEAKKN